MLSFEPNIIFIDDKKEEVNEIMEMYQAEGIGVKYFNAHLHDGETKPTKLFSDVNLIFLDVHFTSNNNDYDPEHCSGWVESIVPKNSFYILVIWSKETDKKDEILEELKKSERSPFLCLPEQKSDYQIKDGYEFFRLYQKIESELEQNPELEELALWKKSIKDSSNRIIGHLCKDTDSDAFKKKLQKIIIGHGGTSYISNKNQDQKREILFEALDNVLISNAKGTRPVHDISDANKNNLYNIGDDIQTNIDSKLNSWFHFKLHKEPLNQSIIKSGLICKYYDNQLQKVYALLKDDNIEEYLKPQIAQLKVKGSNTELIDIVLLISRPCDIAQNKYGRNLKLISGIFIKNPKRKSNLKKELKTGQKFDSIKLFDHLYFSEETNDIAIVFDFRYVFSVPEKTFIDKFENIKIFNKELLSEIQVEYGSYSSRLGITQII